MWKASNDIGYAAYRDFILKPGKSSAAKAVTSPAKSGQRSSSGVDSSVSKSKSSGGVKTGGGSKTEHKAAPSGHEVRDHDAYRLFDEIATFCVSQFPVESTWCILCMLILQ